jgi:hypothetical protein
MLVLRLIKTLISNHNLITELSLVYFLSRLISTSCAGQLQFRDRLRGEHTSKEILSLKLLKLLRAIGAPNYAYGSIMVILSGTSAAQLVNVGYNFQQRDTAILSILPIGFGCTNCSQLPPYKAHEWPFISSGPSRCRGHGYFAQNNFLDGGGEYVVS